MGKRKETGRKSEEVKDIRIGVVDTDKEEKFVKVVLLICLFMLVIMVGACMTVHTNQTFTGSDKKLALMAEECKTVSINGKSVEYPITVDGLTEAGFAVVEPEISLSFAIDTESFENVWDLSIEGTPVGSVAMGDSGEVTALRVAIGNDWTVGGLTKGMNGSEMINKYGEPAKCYTGVYTGGLYDLGDYRIYVNTVGAVNSTALLDFVYVMGNDGIFVPEMTVEGKRMVLGKDIYATIDNLMAIGYNAEIIDTEVLQKYDIVDKDGERVGNIIYDGINTGNYTISVMGNVSVGAVNKGMTEEELRAALAEYGEPEALDDGTLMFKIGYVYDTSEMALIVGFDEKGKVNQLTCNITSIISNVTFVPQYDEEEAEQISSGIATGPEIME